MPYTTTLYARFSRSARGELFNPLIYPFLFATLAYGVGFVVSGLTEHQAASSLYNAMITISPTLTYVWGALAIVVILVGLYVLAMDKPPIGKANCFVAWMLWCFASIVYIITGGWLPLFSVAVPSLYFWTWQYFSLAKFRQQDRDDKATMRRYDAGRYDDELNPKDSKVTREDNRGVNPEDRKND